MKPERRMEGDSPRLVAALDAPSFSACKPDEPVLIAVPNYKNEFDGKQAYVWVGDDVRTGCFGTIPVARFLALADAIRAKEPLALPPRCAQASGRWNADA